MKKDSSVLYFWTSSTCIKVQAMIFSSARRTSRNSVHQSLHFHKAFSVNLLLVCICTDEGWAYMLYFLPAPSIKLSTLLPWRFVSVTIDNLFCRDFQHGTFNLLRTRQPDCYLLLTVICIIPSKSHQDSRNSVVADAMLHVTPLHGEQFCPVVSWVSYSIVLWKTEYAERKIRTDTL